MNKIMDTLPDNHISNETLWIYKDNIEIFNKYNQQVIHKISDVKSDIKSEIKSEIKSDFKFDVKSDVKSDFKFDVKSDVKFDVKSDVKREMKKQKIESPIDLIIRLTLVDKLMKQDIKEKLIEFISLPEFSKVFGMKKTSEIMTALSKESWNQSISLFISFLLDKHIIYKEKSYIYNKEKVIIEPSIIVS